MIFSVFQKNWVFGYSWSTLLWYRCYYPHRSRDALSPVCGIFVIKVLEMWEKQLIYVSTFLWISLYLAYTYIWPTFIFCHISSFVTFHNLSHFLFCHITSLSHTYCLRNTEPYSEVRVQTKSRRLAEHLVPINTAMNTRQSVRGKEAES